VRIAAGDLAQGRVAHGSSAPAGADVADILRWATSVGPRAPHPGGGATVSRWELLATTAARDLTVARVLEPHLDALSILAEDGQHPAPSSSWGVWAAEQPGSRLSARGSDATGWVLEGRKPWCSLAGSVTHALVTAWVEEHGWVPAGLARVVTGPVSMTGVPARPVGPAGWYFDRDGFWWGGIGVAAVWYGGAVGLARRLLARAASRPDDLTLMHLGEVDAALAAARSALDVAAAEIDAGRATGPAAALLGARVRHVVATAAEDVARHVAHAVGPGPLSQEPDHVARVADLALYLRQHHAERDAAALGRLLLEGPGGVAPW
jgi:alkylation response protein AidB-like acyl-CoA dehydrogenase